MKNSVRNFVRIIKEICSEENIELKSFSYDWIFELRKGENYNYIIGYQFGLNSASVNSICCDKSAASEIMNDFNIPNVEHRFFMSPVNQKYVSDFGNWETLIEMLETNGQLVCKSNDGTGGNNVFHVKNQFELEQAVFKIFQKSRSMAVSSYYEIENEYRTTVLNGMIKLIYSKRRPYIVGDGLHTVGSLIFDYLSNHEHEIHIEQVNNDDLMRILDSGEHFYLNWKHNLGQGANAKVIEDEKIVKKISVIVNEVVTKMNVKFASIDIVECKGEYKVLEINSGVMMEHFSQQDETSYQIAKSIYKEAILKMFDKGGSIF